MNEARKEKDKRRRVSNLKWIVGALVLLILAYASASGFVVYSLYAVLLIMILSRLTVEVCLRGLDVRRELSRTETVIGDKLEVTLTVRNTGGLPIPWVLVEELLPGKMPVTGERARLFTLGPHKEKKMVYQIVLNRRGYHRIGPALLEAGDLFGFFRRYKTLAAADYVTVFPAVEHIMEFDIAARRPMGTVKVTNKIFEDPTKIIGVREYVPGDPFNRIHWKTTARTGTLYSKVYEPSKVLGATFILDFHRSGYRGMQGHERGELAVTTVASLADYITGANEQVGLVTNGRDLAEVARYEAQPLLGKIRRQIVSTASASEKPRSLAPLIIPTRKSAEQGRLMLETLARLDYTDGLTIDKALEYSIQRLGRDSATLVVAPELTDALALSLGILKEAGYLVSLFIIQNEPGYFEAVDKMASRFIDVYHIRGFADVEKFATQDVYY
ncbi:MAG: DUF58 domain-containing protein [Candidatus Abyssubacteria bacterium]